MYATTTNNMHKRAVSSPESSVYTINGTIEYGKRFMGKGYCNWGTQYLVYTIHGIPTWYYSTFERDIIERYWFWLVDIHIYGSIINSTTYLTEVIVVLYDCQYIKR